MPRPPAAALPTAAARRSAVLNLHAESSHRPRCGGEGGAGRGPGGCASHPATPSVCFMRCAASGGCAGRRGPLPSFRDARMWHACPARSTPAGKLSRDGAPSSGLLCAAAFLRAVLSMAPRQAPQEQDGCDWWGRRLLMPEAALPAVPPTPRGLWGSGYRPHPVSQMGTPRLRGVAPPRPHMEWKLVPPPRQTPNLCATLPVPGGREGHKELRELCLLGQSLGICGGLGPTSGPHRHLQSTQVRRN